MSNLQSHSQIHNEESVKKLTYLAYILYFVGTISLGIFSIIGLILCYVRRRELENSMFYTHLSYLIKTFWIFIILEIIGIILLAAKGLGILILIPAYIWYLYRLVSGFTKLSDNRSI